MDNIVWEEKTGMGGLSYNGRLRTSQLKGAGMFLIYWDAANGMRTKLPYLLRVKLPGIANDQRPSKTVEEAKALAETVLKHWMRRTGLCFTKAAQQEEAATEK